MVWLTVAGGEYVAHMLMQKKKFHPEVKNYNLLILMSFQIWMIFFVLWKNFYAPFFLYCESDEEWRMFPKKILKTNWFLSLNFLHTICFHSL